MSNSTKEIEIVQLSFEELIDVMENIPQEHWEEVPFGNFQLELNLCEEVYISSEQQGYARFYSAWVGEEFAGYISVMASEMIQHKGTIQAVTDAFYIAPEYRSSGVFNKLLEHVEQDLALEGIRFLTVGINPNMPHKESVHDYLAGKGYIITELSMTKEV